MGKTLAKFLDAINNTRNIKNDSEDKIMADMKSIDPGLGNTDVGPQLVLSLGTNRYPYSRE